MRKIFRFIQDFWEAIGIFAGVAIMAYEFVAQLYAAKGFSLNTAVWIGLGIFVFFGILAIMKANRKARDAQIPKSNNRTQIEFKNQGDSITAGGNISDSPILKAEGYGKVAGRDIIETHHHYNQKKTSPDRPRNVNLGIEVQVKLINEEPYLVVVITNAEIERIYSRMEIHGIYDEADSNILRNISQFANHFSWSGGRASEDGMKAIEAGLDGTVNIAVIHHAAFNFYWLFHEDPNKNWLDPGVYKLNLTVQGTIGGDDFVGHDLEIKFKYVEHVESDEMGGFSNKGKLELLDWKVDNHVWYMI